MKRIIIISLCLILMSFTACDTVKETEPEDTYKIIERELLTPEMVIEEFCELGNYDYMLQTPGCNELYNEQINLSEPVVKSYRLSDNDTGAYIQLLCLASEEDAKMAGYRYDDYDYSKRMGAMFLFGTSEHIEALSLSEYKYPDSFEPENTEDPEPQSVAGMVKTIEDATELCGGYYSDSIIAATKENISKKITLKGDILDIVHLTYHDGTVLRFVYIYEFDNEDDAALYEADRAIFAQNIENGVCVRLGNKVIFGNHAIISETYC